MTLIHVDELMAISIPVMEGFVAVEPRPWTRKTLLLELVGEIGSLAHLVQHWDGFKRGLPAPAHLADECSDVLFITLRLACSEGIPLPQTIEVQQASDTATGQTLELIVRTANLLEPTCNLATELVGILAALGSLALLLGVDLDQAHRREMEIAQQYFKASGSRWPRPQPLRYPLAVFQLARLLWKKNR
jgi:NTP pyrophosphatase (non-canonical NTP hydrolase)